LPRVLRVEKLVGNWEECRKHEKYEGKNVHGATSS